MPTTGDVVRDRIASVCASDPFRLFEAQSPFDFDQVPTGLIDGAFRVTATLGSVIGGFNYTEERTDVMEIWVARKQGVDPKATYRQLQQVANSLRAAVIRDGSTGGGDFHVPDDGAGVQIDHEAGREFAVLRLTLPANFEALV